MDSNKNHKTSQKENPTQNETDEINPFKDTHMIENPFWRHETPSDDVGAPAGTHFEKDFGDYSNDNKKSVLRNIYGSFCRKLHEISDKAAKVMHLRAV